MFLKIPYATKTSAAVAGLSVASLFLAGELLGGTFHVLLSVIGTVWFIVSIFLFVCGRRPLECNNDWLAGKRSYWAAQKDIAPRLLAWFCSVILLILLFNILLQ